MGTPFRLIFVYVGHGKSGPFCLFWVAGVRETLTGYFMTGRVGHGPGLLRLFIVVIVLCRRPPHLIVFYVIVMKAEYDFC